MKDKVLIFIIGLLVGSILSTGGFLIYTKLSDSNINNKELLLESHKEIQNFQNEQQDRQNIQEREDKSNKKKEDSSSKESSKKNKSKVEENVNESS